MTRRMARVLGGTAAAVLLCVCTSYGQTLQPCQDNCIQVSVGAPTPAGPYNIGDPVRVPIEFQQAPTGPGVNDIAALALTLDIPGLQLANCDNPDANGITSAIDTTNIGDMYRVVVENTSCTDDPTRPCLCPGAGQQLADHVNIVVFGPKDLPTPGSGPVDIPTLPNGELVALNLTVTSGASNPTLLHLFAETDGASAPAKPSFSAYLSVGDKNAVDQTGDRDAGVSKVTTTDQSIGVNVAACCGDKDGGGSVSSAEATQAVLAFGRRDKSLNPSADCNGDGTVSSSEATRVVLNFGRRECKN